MSTTQKKEKQRPKLNQDLCVDNFELVVPKECRLLGDLREDEGWKGYLQKLAPEIPPEELPTDEGCSCDCKPGWKLEGEWAIRHAAKVHEEIHRQILSLEKVSAVDVGFAISEREARFWTFLAIRVHVAKKRPPEQLFRVGIDSLTQPAAALKEVGGVGVLDLDLDPPPKRSQSGDSCCTGPAARARWKVIRRIIIKELPEKKGKSGRDFLKPYPVTGISPKDLSLFCPRSIAETRSIEDIRLCICGVPIDIVNAEYSPSIAHPGGDAGEGVFVGESQGSQLLSDEEHLLIGKGRVNPLVGGVSTGSITGQAGTLSTLVWDRTDGTACALSNWHVLAGTPAARVGQPTYQPALFDGGTEADTIARLKRWHLGQKGDAAIAELTGNRHFASGEILGLWHPISGYLRAELGMEVRKWGRTTGFSEGFVDGIHLATNIDYGNGVVRYFKDQFHIAPLRAGEDVSRTGDSGSLVVTSFRPVQLQKDLKQTVEWLRTACRSDPWDSIYREMWCVFKKLRTEAGRLPADGPIVCAGIKVLIHEVKGRVGDCAGPLETILAKLASGPQTFDDELVEILIGVAPGEDPLKELFDHLKGGDEYEMLRPHIIEFENCAGVNYRQAITRTIQSSKTRRLFSKVRDFQSHRSDIVKSGVELGRQCVEEGDRCGRSTCCLFISLLGTLQKEPGLRTIEKIFHDLGVKTKKMPDSDHYALIETLVAVGRLGTCDEKVKSLWDHFEAHPKFYAQVKGELDDLREKLLGYPSLCDIFWNTIEGSDELRKLSGTFCFKLRFFLKKFRNDCRSDRSWLSWLESFRKFLTCAYQECCDCGLAGIDRIERKISKAAKTGPFGDLSKAIRRDEGGDPCDYILDLVQLIDHFISFFERRIDLIEKLMRSLERWVELCSGMSDAKEKLNKLCRLMLLKCDRKPCPETYELVACLREGLKKLEAKDALQCKDGAFGFETPSHADGVGRLVEGAAQETSLDYGLVRKLTERVLHFLDQEEEKEIRHANRAYYAVGMLFAGDTPGSPLGEFGVASDIETLADELRFSLRPVFEPRSSFRELRVRPETEAQVARALRSSGGLTPGGPGEDPRATGPQPIVESGQTKSSDRSTGGNG